MAAEAYRHGPSRNRASWANVHYPPIDYQAISYYSSPKTKDDAARRVWTEVDPELLKTYEKLGIPLRSRKSSPASPSMPCSTACRWRRRSRASSPSWELFFGSFSEAVQIIPSWCRSISARWCPIPIIFLPRLNSAVFSDGSFCYIPRACGVRWSCRLIFASTRPKTGQFERTLIVAEEGSLRELPRRLYRANARSATNCTRPWSSWWRMVCADQVFHGAELVSG